VSSFIFPGSQGTKSLSRSMYKQPRTANLPYHRKLSIFTNLYQKCTTVLFASYPQEVSVTPTVSLHDNTRSSS